LAEQPKISRPHISSVEKQSMGIRSDQQPQYKTTSLLPQNPFFAMSKLSGIRQHAASPWPTSLFGKFARSTKIAIPAFFRQTTEFARLPLLQYFY
jgi:hypothetical protein